MNGDVIATLTAIIGADVSGLTSGLTSAAGSLKNFGGDLMQVGGAMTALTAPITAFFATSVQEASNLETVTAQMNATLKSTKDASGQSAEGLQAMAAQLSKVTRYSDDTIMSGQNLLLTFTNIGKDTFPQATQAMLDMSTAMGQDLKSSAIQLGKALNDPEKGLTALTRIGVTFTEEQKATIKSMVDAGNAAGAQAVILKELEREFGNSAAAAGDTFAGKVDIAGHSLQDLQQKVGGIVEKIQGNLLPVLTEIIGKVSDWIDKNPQLATTIITILGALAALGPVLLVVGGAISAIGTIVGAVGAVLGSTLLAPILAVVAAFALLKKAYDDNFLGFKDTVDKVVGFIQVNLPLIPFYFQYWIGKIWSVVQPLLQPLLDWFGGTGSNSFGGAVTTAYNTVIKPALDNLSKLLGGIWAAVSPALTSLYDWFVTTGLPFIGTIIQSTVDNFIKPLITTIAGIWTAIQPALQSVFDWFTSSGLPAVGNFINSVLNNNVLPFINTLMNIWTSVGPALNDFMNGVNNIFQWILTNVIDPFSKGIQSIIDIINQLRGITPPGGGQGSGGGSRGFSSGASYTQPNSTDFVPQSFVNTIPGVNGAATLHIVLQADDFQQHIYTSLANAIQT